MTEEQVFVFDAPLMKDFDDLPGISTKVKDRTHLVADCVEHGYFTPRTEAENNIDQKQIIPYVVIRRKDKILAYQRSKQSGEGRLHNKWSVGVGGHINPEDIQQNIPINDPGLQRIIMLGAAIGRELTEELDWGDQINCTVNNLNDYGVLYDDKDPVGRVHIGYIFTVDVPEDSKWPIPAENTIADSRWVSLKEAKALPNLEGWSKMVVDSMIDAE